MFFRIVFNFLAVDLHCLAQASLVAVKGVTGRGMQRLLIAVVSLGVKHGL